MASDLLLKLLTSGSPGQRFNTTTDGDPMNNSNNRIRSLLIDALLPQHNNNPHSSSSPSPSSSPDAGLLLDLLRELQDGCNGNNSTTTGSHMTNMCAATEEKCRMEMDGLRQEISSLKRDQQDKQASIIVLKDQVRELSAESEDLRDQLKQLPVARQEVSLLEQTLADLRKELDSKLQVIDSKDQLLAVREARITTLTEDVRRGQEMVGELQSNVLNLTRDVHERDLSIKRLTAETTSQGHELLDLRGKFSESQEQVTSLTADLTKANEIIRKLQTEVNKAKEKVSVLNEVSARQEDIVSDKEQAMRQLESDLKVCITRIQKKEKEQENQIKELERLRSRFHESQEQITTNEQLINFLNQQIADLTAKVSQAEQVNRNTGPSANMGNKKKPLVSIRSGLSNRNSVPSTTSTAASSSAVNGMMRGSSANTQPHQQQELLSQQLRVLRQQAAQQSQSTRMMANNKMTAMGSSAPQTTSSSSPSDHRQVFCPPEPEPTALPASHLMRAAAVAAQTGHHHQEQQRLLLPHVNLMDKHLTMNRDSDEAAIVGGTTAATSAPSYQRNPLFGLTGSGVPAAASPHHPLSHSLLPNHHLTTSNGPTLTGARPQHHQQLQQQDGFRCSKAVK